MKWLKVIIEYTEGYCMSSTHFDCSTSQIEISVAAHFDFLSDEYQTLFDQSYATVFQTPFWLDAFYRKLPIGLNAEPVVITVRESTEKKLLALMPLVRQTKFGTHVVQPADLGISDYNSIIAGKQTLEMLARDDDFKANLKRALNPVDILLFRKQRPDVFDISQLLDSVQLHPNENASFEMEMNLNFDEWQQTTLSKSNRKGLARKRRNFNKDIGPLGFRTLTDADDIEKAFNFLRKERSKRHPDDLLNQQTYFEFYLDVAIHNAKSGKAVTYIGEVNGELVTVDFGLCEKDQHIMLLGAYASDEKYRKYSPGLQAIMDMMQSRKEIGVNFFDFSIGDEDYKGSFGAERVELTNVIWSNSLKGHLAMKTYCDGSLMKMFIKKLSPNIH